MIISVIQHVAQKTLHTLRTLLIIARESQPVISKLADTKLILTLIVSTVLRFAHFYQYRFATCLHCYQQRFETCSHYYQYRFEFFNYAYRFELFNYAHFVQVKAYLIGQLYKMVFSDYTKQRLYWQGCNEDKISASNQGIRQLIKRYKDSRTIA